MSAKLLLMRHGESIWNKKNLFTGWVDVPLSEKGVQEALAANKILQNHTIDIAFTSTLERAHTTLTLSLLHFPKTPVFLHPETEWGHMRGKEEVLPVHMAWELNERYYGDLQGLNKEETAAKYGAKQVQLWRRSFDVAPPGGESLEMTAQRTIPYFQKMILPHLEQGKSVFICAHGNSLRSILMHLDGLSQEEVVHLEIPTGEPFVWKKK